MAWRHIKPLGMLGAVWSSVVARQLLRGRNKEDKTLVHGAGLPGKVADYLSDVISTHWWFGRKTRRAREHNCLGRQHGRLPV